MNSLQCEAKNKFFFNNNLFKSTKEYAICLLLSTGKKNCTAMASSLGIKFRSIYNCFNDFKYEEEELKKYFIALVNLHATKENPGVIIGDGTQISKRYGKKFEESGYDFNSAIKSVIKGLTMITLAWTNGEIIIPLDFICWVREKDLKNKEYKKKTAITKELILKYKDKVPFKFIALDGDYGNRDFLLFLDTNNIPYVMRMPKNREVWIDGKLALLKDQPIFQLKRNAKYVKGKGSYKDINMYFITHKRKGKNNTKQVVFIASNIEGLSPKEYVDLYDCRWPIEMMFRTLKQSLGLQQCQSISMKNQRGHIFATFLALVELDIQKINKKKTSREQVLKNLRLQNIAKINPEFTLGDGVIM